MPVIRLAGLTEAQIKALRIADNKLALNASWDYDLLHAELSDLYQDEYDLSLIGFSSSELEGMLEELNEEEGMDTQTDEMQEADAGTEEESEDGFKNTRCCIGEYSFMLTPDEYLSMIKDIQLTRGFTNEEICTELKRRIL